MLCHKKEWRARENQKSFENQVGAEGDGGRSFTVKGTGNKEVRVYFRCCGNGRF